MDAKQRVLAFDIGDKRIGVAVSDRLCIAATGVETYNRVNLAKDIEHIKMLYETYAPCTILFGMPRNMNGSYGFQSDKVKAFAKKVEAGLDVKVEFFDERLSTVAAERVLIDANLSREKRKKVIDKMAAVVILQSYLDFLTFTKNKS